MGNKSKVLNFLKSGPWKVVSINKPPHENILGYGVIFDNYQMVKDFVKARNKSPYWGGFAQVKFVSSNDKPTYLVGKRHILSYYQREPKIFWKFITKYFP